MSDAQSETATAPNAPTTYTRQNYNTSNPYESQFGYSRAVRKGPFIFVSGTTSTSTTSTSTSESQSKESSSPTILHPTSAYLQSVQIFSEIVSSIRALGGSKQDITRVRMFVTYDEDSGEVGRALKEVLGDVGPAATMILGVKFVHPDMRVEIEADAVVG